jgi:hypothetical protein
MVGRTPWSAADALVGLCVPCVKLIGWLDSGTGASRADQGVRPTYDFIQATHWRSVEPPGPRMLS